MKLRLALILSFALVGPSVALACMNSMRLDGDDAVKQIANAERLLARGELGNAERLVDPSDYDFDGRGLRKKANLVFHTAAIRRGVAKYRLKSATRFLNSALQKNPEDPLLISRNAEALALSDKTAGKARAALEDLAKRDLMPEAQSYTALARLLSKAGEKAAADEAVASCLKMTKHKVVCSLAPKTRKKNRRRSNRSRGVLGSSDGPALEVLTGSSN